MDGLGVTTVTLARTWPGTCPSATAGGARRPRCRYDGSRPSAMDRRRLLGGLAAGAVGLGALSACTSNATRSAQAGDARTVDTANGPVEVPASPQRVVCTDFYTTYALLDVGFSPVGTAEATVGGVLPSQQRAYDELAKVGKTTEINYEAVAALTPDLILGTLVPGLADDLYERLSAIAPTALFQASSPGDWKSRAVRAADVVGRKEAGDRLAEQYRQRVDRIRTDHADALAATTWALFRATTNGTAFVDGPTSWSGVVLADLGATFTAAAPTETAVQEIAAERYDLLADADVILYLANAQGAADPSTDRVISGNVFTGLVPDAELVPLSSYYAAHYLDGMTVLDQIERILTAR